MGKDREPAGDWAAVEVEDEWVETAQARVPREIAGVLAVEQRLLIRLAFPVMI
jgi:hypothetical protein